MFAYVGGAGYVGIGHITAKVIPPRDADVEIEGRPQPLLDQPDVSAAWKHDAASRGGAQLNRRGEANLGALDAAGFKRVYSIAELPDEWQGHERHS